MFVLYDSFSTEEKKEETAAAELHEESYLHPSLQPTSAQSVGYRRDVTNCQFSLVLGDLKLCVAFVYGLKNKIVLHVKLLFFSLAFVRLLILFFLFAGARMRLECFFEIVMFYEVYRKTLADFFCVNSLWRWENNHKIMYISLCVCLNLLKLLNNRC